jgi:hypothetical protein
LADRHFLDPGYEDALADSLRAKPALIDLWENWSADQRWAFLVHLCSAPSMV